MYQKLLESIGVLKVINIIRTFIFKILINYRINMKNYILVLFIYDINIPYSYLKYKCNFK